VKIRVREYQRKIFSWLSPFNHLCPKKLSILSIGSKYSAKGLLRLLSPGPLLHQKQWRRGGSRVGSRLELPLSSTPFVEERAGGEEVRKL
jgi:hypothetical protein